MKFLFSLAVAGMVALGAVQANANTVPLSQWVDEVKREAVARGISPQVVEAALKGFEPNETVIRLDRKQPEGSLSFAQYMQRVVPVSRIREGQRKYHQYRSLLNRIGAKYGVQPRFIVALWGVETNYGSNTGGFDIIPALATLAYDGRRAEFFRDELMKALKIVSDGHIPLRQFDGSWAGAMGQSQFMPSSFLSYAVDENGDGRKDIWHTQEDVFASIANYLRNMGWEDDVTWGRRVTLPKGFNPKLANREIKKPITTWARMGVRKHGGGALPARSDIMASIVFPGKEGEEAYMTYANYDRIMKWNRSTYFATAVGTLADAIGR